MHEFLKFITVNWGWFVFANALLFCVYFFLFEHDGSPDDIPIIILMSVIAVIIAGLITLLSMIWRGIPFFIFVIGFFLLAYYFVRFVVFVIKEERIEHYTSKMAKSLINKIKEDQLIRGIFADYENGPDVKYTYDGFKHSAVVTINARDIPFISVSLLAEETQKLFKTVVSEMLKPAEIYLYYRHPNRELGPIEIQAY